MHDREVIKKHVSYLFRFVYSYYPVIDYIYNSLESHDW